LRRLADREAGPRDLLEEGLDQRRHVAEPERKDQYEVVCPGDVLLHRRERGGNGAGVPLLLAAQERKVELRHLDPTHVVHRRPRAGLVAIAQGMAEVIAAAIG
jgi:hypothetical protein